MNELTPWDKSMNPSFGLFQPTEGEDRWTFDHTYVGHARYVHTSGLAVVVVPCFNKTIADLPPSVAGGWTAPVGGIAHGDRTWVVMVDLAPGQAMPDRKALLDDMPVLALLAARKSVVSH